MILIFSSLLLALALDFRFYSSGSQTNSSAISSGKSRIYSQLKKYHPLWVFRRYAHFLNILLNRSSYKKSQLIHGVVAALLAVIPFISVFVIVQHSLPVIVNVFIDVAVLYLCLGWSGYQQKIKRIFDELNVNQIDSARAKLANIISSETSSMNGTQIAQESIESIFKNSLSLLFAISFWFIFTGVEGALLYRLVSILHEEWGNKGDSSSHFSHFSTYIYDALNFIPVRLMSYGMIFCASSVDQGRKALTCWKAQAKRNVNRNDGILFSTGAGALNVRLGEGAWHKQNGFKSAKYKGDLSSQWKAKPTMGCGDRAQPKDMLLAIQLVRRTLIFWLLTIGGLSIVL